MDNKPFPELARVSFVGREDTLNVIDGIASRTAGQPTIIFVTGRGGVGKTELLKEILRRYGEKPDWCVAKDVVDMYHTDVRTKFGLVDQIVITLPQSDTDLFSDYAEHRSEYSRQLLSASGVTIRQQLEEMRERFRTGLTDLCTRSRVMIALDTAEKLVYPSEQRDAAPLVDELLGWLCEMLQGMGNIVLLVAGRQKTSAVQDVINALRNKTAEYAPLQVHLVDLPPFRLEDSEHYLQALVDRLQQSERLEEAARIAQLPPSILQNAHQQTDGDPISLALMADLIATGRDLPETLFEQPETGEQRDAHERDARREELQQWFIEGLMARPELGETLKALGYLPRGATAGLLAQIMGVTIDDAQQRLSAIAHLTIVKIRSDSQRVFLHDEIYAMLRRWIQSAPNQSPINKKVHQSIYEYYDQAIEQAQRAFNGLSGQLEQAGTPLPGYFDRLTAANNHRRELLSEALYYRFRQSADLGFDRYCRYTGEAILIADLVFDRELQTISIEFMADSADVVVHEMIWGVLASRPVARLWAEGNYDKAIEKAEELHQGQQEIRSIADAVIDVWNAYSRIYRGGKDHLKTAKKLLDSAEKYLRGLIANLDEILAQDQPAAIEWRKLAALGLALRVRGYLSRSAGRLRAAIPDYKEAAKIFAGINFRIELATTLNDLGFTQAELGKVNDGRWSVRRALDLRSQLASIYGVAYSLNTLAMIDVFEGNVEAAIPLAERARNIFRSIKVARGEGLSELTLAEAQRRASNPEKMPDPAKRIEGLRQALDHAARAREIFSGEPEPERLRLAHTWVETGCAHRDLVLAYRDQNADIAIIDATISESENALRTAATVAEGVNVRWQIDAWVNLVWLGNYAGQEYLLREADGKARGLIHDNGLADHFVDEKLGKPKVAEDQGEAWVWGQIGKLHVALAKQSLLKYQQSKPEGLDRDIESKHLKEAIRHYAIGLENNHYGHESGSRDLERVKMQIGEEIRRLAPKEKHKVRILLSEYETEFHLPTQGSFMRNFLEERILL